MGVVSSKFDSITPTDSFLGVLDQFASLRSYSSAPAVGGYRMLAPKGRDTGRERRPAAAVRSAAAATAALAAIAHARVRITGSLAVLFIGGLGLAVLAGPANCPCTVDLNVAQRSSLMRLGYVENAHFVGTREQMTGEPQLPALSVAAAVEPAESSVGESPITTSALEPSREIATMTREGVGAVSAGALPRIESLSDAGPAVRLAVRFAAASNIESDVSPELPVITARTPPAKVASSDADDEPPRAKRKKNLRAYRTPVAKSERHAARPGDEQLVKRAPKWAQQMYVTPWQMQAFSYTR